MSYDGFGTSRVGVEFGPVPDAFDTTPLVFGTRDPRALSTRGLCHWLSHAQADLTGPENIYTNRTVVQVIGGDGLQAAARFEATFNPHHERLIVHAVRVHRGGEIREAGVPQAFEVIQRELNMERAVYDGRITAHMVIPDVREGDVVETLHSIVGANPALKGHFAWWFILQWSNPVVETRCVVRAPTERAFTIRKLASAPDPVEVVAGGVRTLDWRVLDGLPYVPDRGSPPSYVGYDAVHIADAMTWAEVADVFRTAYEPQSLPPELAASVAEMAARHDHPADRLVEGLRMVQGALRYHSVSVGEGGYRPRAVDQIWATRYGDCKDGSVLLTAVLRALGIDAVCALVNTAFGDDLLGVPPNVLSFNHCIVRARVDGIVLWLDATLPPQAGDIGHLSQAHFDWALPLEAGAKLEPIPSPDRLTIRETTETWTFQRRKGPATLEMRSVYRGWRADNVRRWMSNEGAETVARQLREGLEHDIQSPMESLLQVEVVDDAANNTITTIERYEVERPFKTREQGGASIFVSRDDVVGPQLPEIGPDRRREPLAIGWPRAVQTTRIFNFPTTIQISPWRETLTGPGDLRLDTAFEWRSSTQGVHTLRLQTGDCVLPPARSEAYRDFLTRARSNNGITFVVPFKNGKMESAASKEPGWTPWAIWAGIVVCLALFRVLAG